MKKILPLVFIFIHVVGYSCINGKGLNIFGETKYHHHNLFQVKKIHPKDHAAKIRSQEAELKKLSEKDRNWEYYNELGILKIYLGEYPEAKKALFKAASLDKFNYSVCSNLGVVYELTGMVDSAYYYTDKAIKIDPASHGNSEWIHLAILSAYKKMEADPNWIYTNSIVGFKFSKTDLPTSKYTIGKSQARSDSQVQLIAHQIEYQLKERMIFVKPKNAIVANLLFSLGELYITEIDCERARQVYELAMEYDPKLTDLCNKRISGVVHLLNPYAERLKVSRDNAKRAREKAEKAKIRSHDSRIDKLDSQLQLKIAIIYLEKSKQKKYALSGGAAFGLIIVVLIIRKRKRNKRSLHP